MTATRAHLPLIALLWVMTGCVASAKVDRSRPEPATLEGALVTDEGLASGYQDSWFGTFNRGRGNVVADFDGDGDPDLFSGNPGGYSFLIRNTSVPGGPLSFEPWQVLSETELFYGGVAVDFDNDGDPDLFVAAGANDGVEADRMFRNDLDRGADPAMPLVDISAQMSLVPHLADGTPVLNGTMGARAFDVNGDGLLDLWADNFATSGELTDLTPADVFALNQLYINLGDFDLEDWALALGLDYQGGSRHSSVFDFDRDGDFDIYENNFSGSSILWQNRLVEDGALGFLLANPGFELGETLLTGSPLAQPMCSIPVDLDNDGWDDLLVLNRGVEDDSGQSIRGHQIFMNQQGMGFVDVTAASNLSAGFEDHPEATDSGPMGSGWGVMGCQVGDVNLDGFPDVFIGTGVGATGGVNRLFVSSQRISVSVDGGPEVPVPMFEDWTSALDFPAELPAEAPDVPYPYRTHGSAFADYDGDGIPELGVHNGGPAMFDFKEPNRLWKFHLDDPRFLRVDLHGDGVSVNRDAVGTRVKLTVERDRDGATWDLYQTRIAGSGFGAQNEATLTFGLGDGDRVRSIVVSWPDGLTVPVDPPEGSQAWIAIDR